jgi:hypothetical protein
MQLTRRSAGIVPSFQPSIEGYIEQTTADDENFFRIGMTFGTESSGISTRIKPR